MKVAAVSMLCQDERVFDAMKMAGTPCPFEGKIGEAAQAEGDTKLKKQNKRRRADETLFLTVCSLLFLASSYSYSEEYTQQYQVGDVGPNGGEVTSVTVNEVYVGEEVVQDGDFLEVTHTYEYTETIIEQVEEVSFTTVTEVTSVTTPNLITDDESTYTDTNVSTGGNFGMPGADFTTGHEGLSGGTRMYEGGFENEDIQTLDYGVTVHSYNKHSSM